MITHSEKITGLMGALYMVQGSVKAVQKDSKNPHFKNSYASLEAVVEAIRPACQKHGLVVMQAPGEFREGAVTVETMITHPETGEWIRAASTLPVAKQDPQGVGSAITYAERYSLMALFNLPPTDDDGESASQRSDYSDRPEPAPMRVVDNAADAKAEGLIKQIQGCRSPDDLDQLKGDPDYVALYNRLSPANKARVLQAGKMKAQSFAPPVMAG